MLSRLDAKIDVSESKDIKKDSEVAQAALNFNLSWFIQIFEKYPLLLKFLTTNIQTSSDQTDPTKSPAIWQKTLYEALRATLKTDIARHYELERTILSIMFFEALQHLDEEALTFVKNHSSNLNREDLNNIRALVNLRFAEISDRDKENIIISLIFGDVGKINVIRNAFEKYGLVTQDQDLAHDYMLELDTDLLSEFFKLPQDAKRQAQALVSGAALLEINEDGVVKILSLNLETKKAPAEIETKRSQLGKNISDHYRKFGLLPHDVQQLKKVEEKISEQALKHETKAQNRPKLA